MSAAVAFHRDYRDIYKGFSSQHVTELRQQMSVLERQLNGQLNSYASSLLNLPLSSQSSLSALNANLPLPAVKTSTKQHPPLTASNSVANCNAASHLKALVSREHRKLDRSVSEPVSQQTTRPVQSNSSRYKTELCRPFEENGTCKYGDKCQFAHGQGELRNLTRHPKYKTELCRTFHSTGFCPYGPRCHFIHNSEDSKKCLLNNLQSSNSIPVNGHSPSKQAKDYDICAFSIGSAGELSPTNSTSSCSSGSPPSSLNGFYLDDNHAYSVPQVPQTAPPTLSSGVFFPPDYLPLKPLPPLVRKEEYSPSQEECLSDDVISSIDLLVSELEMNPLADVNSNADSFSKPSHSVAVDINRNIIRLPIFHSLAIGNSP
ncbi:mRNA decay activator protein ZFP36L1 isoform X2 [Parasteatoda tepidariorum]|uniref:mRNA decay activator protein ZFP36L1 isoform X2 n=1 Tax=Parasteatoda tepidariorum TaxID=114398 RepID=UPI00077FD692|nr:mRNA decay activator protein ZFP36L1 isoform X2 [Parasteatoda tepidariorum]